MPPAARTAGTRARKRPRTRAGVTKARAPQRRRERARRCRIPYPVFAHPRGREFVDLDEDIQIKDLLNSAQEGFDSTELMKRFSTLGMGPSQGKHSNLNGARILMRTRDTSLADTALTTQRPFYHPVPLEQLAGMRLPSAPAQRRP